MKPGFSVTYPTFNAASRAVQVELGSVGLWHDKSRIRKTDVIWCPLPQLPWDALGYFLYDDGLLSDLLGYKKGNIYIPQWVLSQGLSGQRRGSLRDVLRHEYGHAMKYHYPRHFIGRRFNRAFGHENKSDSDYVSSYATTNPEEDFCETFMVWLRGVSNSLQSLRRRAAKSSPRLKAKFAFVEYVTDSIRR